MSLMVKDETGKMAKEVIPADLYTAVTYGVVDCGTHPETYEGVVSDKHKVVILWEIPELRITYKKDDVEKEGPKVISKEYTMSLNEKANLCRDLESWRGKLMTDAEREGFDLKNVLGASCQLQVIHKTSQIGNVYARINAILPCKTKLTPENELLWFSLQETHEIPPEIYGWLKEKIESSKEWMADEAGASGAREEMRQKCASDMPEEDQLPF